MGSGNQLVEVPFHGDTLQAVSDDKGVWVSVLRVCEALGLDRRSQQAKLKNKAWAVGVMNALTGSDGKQYEQMMLHLDCLPMWLATIETSRVKPAIKGKLELYQRECAKVLARHFFGEPKREAGTPVDIISIIAATVRETVRALPAPPVPLGQLVSVKERCRRRWPGVSGNWRRRVRDIARAMLLNRRGKNPMKAGGEANDDLLFERDDLDCLDDAIDQAKDEARAHEEPLALFQG